MSNPTVLVIDDQMQSVAVLLQYFRGQSINVMVALDGHDGLKKARLGHADVILLDVSMPDISGYEVCKTLKRDPVTRDVPVIFLSGNTSVEHKLEGFACGGVDYICKPFSSEEVLARVYVHFKYHGPDAYSNVGFNLASPYRSNTSPEANRNNQILTAAIEILSSQDNQWEGTVRLAHQLGVNEKKLTEIFKHQFGMTVSEYQISQRLENARARLVNSRTQIQIIALESGYQNASDFSRAFKARYGLGPRDYRQAANRSALPPGKDVES